jgi:hypothetical protein
LRSLAGDGGMSTASRLARQIRRAERNARRSARRADIERWLRLGREADRQFDELGTLSAVFGRVLEDAAP